jgi:hypothetical protein
MLSKVACPKLERQPLVADLVMRLAVGALEGLYPTKKGAEIIIGTRHISAGVEAKLQYRHP